MKVVRWIETVLSCGKLAPLQYCAVCERERDNEDDAIMKEGKATMKLRIKQKKQLSGVYEDVTFPTGGNLQCEDDGE